VKKFFPFLLSACCLTTAVLFAAPVRSNLGGDGEEYGESPESTAVLYVQDGLIAMWDAIENADWGVHNPNGFPVNLVTGEHDVPFERFSSIEILPDALIIRGNTTVMSPPLSAIDGDFPYITGEWNVAMMREDNTTSSLDIWTAIGDAGTAWSLNLYLQSSKMTFCRGNNYHGYNIAKGSGEWADGVFSARVSVNKSSDAEYNLAEYFVDGVLKYSANRSAWSFNSYAILNPPKLVVRVLNNSVMVIRNIRLYNRALTPEEIQYNYQIDKARFGE